MHVFNDTTFLSYLWDNPHVIVPADPHVNANESTDKDVLSIGDFIIPPSFRDFAKLKKSPKKLDIDHSTPIQKTILGYVRSD